MTGFAILGAGVIAEYYREAIQANADNGAELVAVGHYREERFEAIREQYGVPVAPYEAVLDHPDVEVVCISTPSGQHAQQAIQAAQAGKHVLVEKPMALTVEEAEAIIAACALADVKLGVALQRRTDPMYRCVYDAIQAGDLGDLTLGVVTIPYYRPQSYYDQAEWRGTWALDGGGVLMNQGIHLIDILIWWMGDPVAIKAIGGNRHRAIEVEDVLVATLRFENGELATVTATTDAPPGFPHRVEVYGTNGGVQTEGDKLTRWMIADQTRATVEVPPLEGDVDAGAGADPRGISHAGHIALVADMLAAIREDRSPLVSGAEGLRSVAVVREIYRQAGLV